MSRIDHHFADLRPLGDLRPRHWLIRIDQRLHIYSSAQLARGDLDLIDELPDSFRVEGWRRLLKALLREYRHRRVIPTSASPACAGEDAPTYEEKTRMIPRYNRKLAPTDVDGQGVLPCPNCGGRNFQHQAIYARGKHDWLTVESTEGHHTTGYLPTCGDPEGVGPGDLRIMFVCTDCAQVAELFCSRQSGSTRLSWQGLVEEGVR